MIDYKCTQCGADMDSPDSLRGQLERCPECGADNTVPPAGAWGELLQVLRQLDVASPSKQWAADKLCDATAITKKCEELRLRPDGVRIHQDTGRALYVYGLNDRKEISVRVICYGIGTYGYWTVTPYSEQALRAGMQAMPESASPPLSSPHGGKWSEYHAKAGQSEQFLACCRSLPAKLDNCMVFSPQRRTAEVSSSASGGDYTITKTYILVKLGHDLFEWIETRSSG